MIIIKLFLITVRMYTEYSVLKRSRPTEETVWEMNVYFFFIFYSKRVGRKNGRRVTTDIGRIIRRGAEISRSRSPQSNVSSRLCAPHTKCTRRPLSMSECARPTGVHADHVVAVKDSGGSERPRERGGKNSKGYIIVSTTPYILEEYV